MRQRIRLLLLLSPTVLHNAVGDSGVLPACTDLHALLLTATCC